jgi:proteasome lid subunit RPN8/RPN11
MYFTDVIREHALRDMPNECCGLIFQENGFYIARPVENVYEPSKDRPERFRMPVNDVLSAIRSKALIAYYHSHTSDSSAFSLTDMAVANEFGLPAYLYCVGTDEFRLYEPTGQKPGLISRPYVPMLYTCVSAVIDWFKEKYDIDLPEIEYTEADAISGRRIASGIAEYFKNDFKPVSKVRPGDIPLMLIKTHNYPNHVGVITPEGELFHHLYQKKSRIESFDGYYKKCSSVVFRYKNFLK